MDNAFHYSPLVSLLSKKPAQPVKPWWCCSFSCAPCVTVVHVRIKKLSECFGVSFFARWILSTQTLCVLSFAGNRASEGGDGEMGEDFLLGGHADGVRGPVLALLVQPLLGNELQEAPRAHAGSAGRHHRGGRDRDPTGVVGAFPQGRRLHWPSVYVSKDHCDALALETWCGFSEMCKTTLKTFLLTRPLENKTRPVSHWRHSLFEVSRGTSAFEPNLYMSNLNALLLFLLQSGKVSLNCTNGVY